MYIPHTWMVLDTEVPINTDVDQIVVRPLMIIHYPHTAISCHDHAMKFNL